MTIWTSEIVDSLSMGGYFRERLSYDDGLHIHAVIARDLRSIIESAFLQAEPPAPCDGNPEGGETTGLDPKDDSAAREAGAPDPSPTRELQAEVERLRRVCTALGKDLRSAEMDRDDARRGEEIWALRCGVVIGRSPIPDAPADLGRLAAETMWRAAGVQSRARWDDCTQEERQRWAYVEAACCERAKANLPEVANLVAENGALMSERDGARRDADRLRIALAESDRKLKEAVGLKENPPEGVSFEVSYVAQDGSRHHDVRSAVERNDSIVRTQAATDLLAAGASVWEAARAWSPFPDPKLPDVLKYITKDTPLIISHWQCRDEPGYKVCRFEEDGYYIFVGGDVGSWSGSYGSKITLLDLARYAEDTLRKHPHLASTTPTQETPDVTG
jgi:hypothetical protein